MTDVYEFSEFDRKNLIYNFGRMTPAEIAVATDKARKAEEEAAAKKAAATAAAAAAKQSGPAQTKPEPPPTATQ
jgi:NADH-quinone oxidoreductase subunit I